MAPVLGGRAGADVAEQDDQGAGHGRLGRPEPADLGGPEPQVVGELGTGRGRPRLPLVVADHPVAEAPAGQLTQQHRQVMDGLDAGVGVVDGGRERLVGDVDQPADAETDWMERASGCPGRA
jgi:hypothetical protein